GREHEQAEGVMHELERAQRLARDGAAADLRLLVVAHAVQRPRELEQVPERVRRVEVLRERGAELALNAAREGEGLDRVGAEALSGGLGGLVALHGLGELARLVQ